jgi:hypothetical protein
VSASLLTLIKLPVASHHQLVSQVLMIVVMASISFLAQDNVREGIFAHIALNEAQGHCHNEHLAAELCIHDSVDRTATDACDCGHEVSSSCSVLDCLAITECVATNCGECADAEMAYLECLIGFFGCDSCIDSLDVTEELPDGSINSI